MRQAGSDSRSSVRRAATASATNSQAERTTEAAACRLMLTKLAGMALLAIVLNPGGEIHHSPAEGPTDQARNEERDNEGYLPKRIAARALAPLHAP